MLCGRQQEAFSTPGKRRPGLGLVSSLICGLSCREVEGRRDHRAAELRPVTGPDNIEDQGGAETVELGEPGWVQPPTQGPLASDAAKLLLLREEDPETCLLALLRWVQRGDTSGVREGTPLGSEREAVDRRQARAGQTWRSTGSLQSCSRGNCLQNNSLPADCLALPRLATPRAL